jgi:peptide/nickel transport system substrate-binding protein
MDDRKNSGGPIDRRTLLQLMAATGSVAAFGGMGGSFSAHAAASGDSEIGVVNPKYKTFYKHYSDYFMNDPQWVAYTSARLKWPAKGERVPDLSVAIPNSNPDWLDAFRKWSNDVAKLGIKFDISQASQARWLELITVHRHGDMETHPSILRPERVDPSEWLTSRAYGADRRNYGEYVCEEYDAVIEAQSREGDSKKRLGLVRKAQAILAEDYYTNLVGWGPELIEAYNSANWDGVVQVRGFGVGSINMPHSYLNMTPKGDRKSLRCGKVSGLETTNLLAATNNMRSIGRLIYDRLAWLDKDLNVVPWAVESWERVDDRTWDMKLRPGMKWHDGNPVTIKDLKFTFDFLQKWERGILWTANRFLDKTEIKDEAGGVLRATFKQPYGQFESYFLQLNVILPEHIWGDIMQKQGIGDDVRRIRIEKPIGSGPFKYGRYRKDADLQLLAHKDHFSAPKVDDLWIVITPTVDGLLGKLLNGEIDMIDTSDLQLRPSQAHQFDGVEELTVLKTPDINWLHVISRPSILPWRDYEFRTAWMHMLDREFLIRSPWEGAGKVPTTDTFLVPGNPWNNPDLPPIPEFNLDKARDILEKAGYTWDADKRLVYPDPGDQKFRERVNKVLKSHTWGGLKMMS